MRIAVAASLFLLLGCPASSNKTPDASMTTSADAPMTSIDAATQPDGSSPPAPDAKVADVPMLEPDAAVPSPDAPLPEPDAATPPDAPLAPDAAETVDAPAPDAAGGTCLPQCFIDLTAPTVLSCVASGTCVRHFDFGTKVLALCWENGVKVGSAIGGSTLVVTTYKSNGDKCFSLETTPQGNGSITNWRNASDVTVAKIIIDDVTKGNIQKYVCGNDPPITVDLNSPGCESARPDAGGSGSGCDTDDPSCTIP